MVARMGSVVARRTGMVARKVGREHLRAGIVARVVWVGFLGLICHLTAMNCR